MSVLSISLVVYLAGAVAVGIPLGCASIWLWAKDESTWPWWAYFVFPTTKIIGKYMDSKIEFLFIEEFDVIQRPGKYNIANSRIYMCATMLIWPLRILGNLALLFLGLFQ